MNVSYVKLRVTTFIPKNEKTLIEMGGENLNMVNAEITQDVELYAQDSQVYILQRNGQHGHQQE